MMGPACRLGRPYAEVIKKQPLVQCKNPPGSAQELQLELKAMTCLDRNPLGQG